MRRRPGRTALVALLVALPWPGMAMAVTLIRTDAATPLEEWQRSYGQADAVGYERRRRALDAPRGLADRSACAPPTMRLKAADGPAADAELTDLPLDDPLTAGIHDLVVGPRAATATVRSSSRPRSPTSSVSTSATSCGSSVPS